MQLIKKLFSISIILLIFSFSFVGCTRVTDIDWEATGTCGAAISSTLLSIFIIIQTNKNNKKSVEIQNDIAEKQIKLQSKLADKEYKTKQLELKINLFDKRYEIYNRFRYYSHLEDNIMGNFPINMPTKDVILAMMNHDCKETKQYIEKREQLLKRISQTNKETIKSKLKDEMEKCNADLFLVYLDYLNKDIEVILLSKFCYPNEISSEIIEYIQAVEQCLYEYGQTTENDLLIDNRLRTSITSLKSKRIKEKIEDLLKLTYDELE